MHGIANAWLVQRPSTQGVPAFIGVRPWGAAAIALAVRSAIIEGATAEDGAVVLVGAPIFGKS